MARKLMLFTGDINLMNVADHTRPFNRVIDTLRSADMLFGNLECCFYQPAGSVSPRPVSRVGSSRLSRPVSSRGDAKGLGLGPLGDSRPLTPGSPRVEVE